MFSTGGYNVKDVVFYWTRGNQSVSGLDNLQLAQYTLEDHYTSESEAVYETGMSTQTHTHTYWRLHVLYWCFYFLFNNVTGNYPKLIFHFKLKRSILYFILETYVPSSALVVLSWVSFWISQSSVPARICIGRNNTTLTWDHQNISVFYSLTNITNLNRGLLHQKV